MKNILSAAFEAEGFELLDDPRSALVENIKSIIIERCENRIMQNIRFVKGVKKIETSIPKQTVTIVYDKTKSRYADFTTAFKRIGYEITPKKCGAK